VKARAQETKGDPSRRRLKQASSLRRLPQPEEETFVQNAREAINRIGPELRRLERLRDRLNAQQQAGSGEGQSETPSLLDKLLAILRHGIPALEEGWVELHDCFSEKGIVRLERQVARERKGR
jgi:hypothetical protein